MIDRLGYAVPNAFDAAGDAHVRHRESFGLFPLFLLRAQVRSLDAGVGETRGNQLDRPNASSLPGEWIGDAVRITVCIENGQTGMLRRLASCTAMRSMRVSSTNTAPERAYHILDAGRLLSSLTRSFSIWPTSFLVNRWWVPSVNADSNFFNLSDAFADGLKVREHAAQPALIDIEHFGALRFLFDDVHGFAFVPTKRTDSPAVTVSRIKSNAC